MTVRPSRQSGPDALVDELVRGVPVRCYADRPRSVVEVLEQGVARWPDRVLLVDPARGTRTSYAGFAALVEGAAQTLTGPGHGLAPGDRVAVLVRNGLEAAVVIWACARAGLVHVGLPVDAPPARLTALLELTGAARLLTSEELRPLAEAAAGAVPVADAAEVLLGRETAWRAGQPLPDEDATYSLIATSGTTGHPKAVQVTGRMSGHAAAAYVRVLGLTPDDRTAVHLPFAWVSGHVTQLTPAMHSGGSAVTMASFSAPLLTEVAAEHDVTWLDVVPSIWELLLRTAAFSLERLPRVRIAVFGGAPAPPGTLERVRGRMPQLRLVDVYALSETCAPVTVLPDVEAVRRPGSVGRPAPYVDLRIVGPDGVDVPGAARPGEVGLRSPTVTPGYWGGQPPLAVTRRLAAHRAYLGRLDGTRGTLFRGRHGPSTSIIRGGRESSTPPRSSAPAQHRAARVRRRGRRALPGPPVERRRRRRGPSRLSSPTSHVLHAAVRDALGSHAVAAAAAGRRRAPPQPQRQGRPGARLALLPG
jgi:acyl-CoA synthetase (AMP-forming)/AMP-acid ligase II